MIKDSRLLADIISEPRVHSNKNQTASRSEKNDKDVINNKTRRFL